MSNPIVQCIISSYPALYLLSRHLSTLDLFHLALTCQGAASFILAKKTFARLKCQSLCDGHGLLARQTFLRDYNGLKGCEELNWRYDYPPGRGKYPDDAKEEVEVHVWAKVCDAYNALPCLKYGVNVYEECRYVPRVLDHDGRDPSRRPHFNRAHQSVGVVCYCKKCDKRIESRKEVKGRQCDCDRYTRWICWRCHCSEVDYEAWYRLYRTKLEKDDLDMEDLNLTRRLYLGDYERHRQVGAGFFFPIEKHDRIRGVYERTNPA